MLRIGTIIQIENGFLLELENNKGSPKNVLYAKDHKEIADLLISKRVAEKLREYNPPVQQELTLDPNDQPFFIYRSNT